MSWAGMMGGEASVVTATVVVTTEVAAMGMAVLM
jgi:hypothetical protein